MDAGIINGQGDKMRRMQKHLDLTIHHAVKDEDDMTTKASFRLELIEDLEGCAPPLGFAMGNSNQRPGTRQDELGFEGSRLGALRRDGRESFTEKRTLGAQLDVQKPAGWLYGVYALVVVSRWSEYG
ncbi:hypothetical protein B0H14DRAFT_3124810 [Mycena olivaceomarginata]|nr:hypothetical protein B0H14DRAFT_3124810 [Mycena olivaceomarginata]